jgi:hypothetical protein
MVVLLKHHLCTSCRSQHNFFLPRGELNTTGYYEYRCPETGHRAQLRPSTAGEEAWFALQGAVVLSAREGGTRMEKHKESGADQTQPALLKAVPDEAAQPRAQAGEKAHGDALAEILEAAWRASGCKKITEIAEELDRPIGR